MKKTKEKTCYQCKFRGEVPGSCHTHCLFDWFNSKEERPKGNKYGISEGWFYFPFNYDPVWMLGQCKEFINK